MDKLLWFIGGLMIGGTVTLIFLCSLQINRVNDYEREIRRLNAMLNEK
ncbi:MAG: inseCt neurotoxin 1c [Clostridia bacterium]|nr:inseCt neurotoxin 1c [Clostridia bacterium]